MIQKLRRKFVAICMLLVTAILLVIFVSSFSSARYHIRRTTDQLLQRVLQEETLAGTGQSPEMGLDIGTGKVQLPYFTVQVWNTSDRESTVYITGGTYDNLENTEELTAILTECLRQNSPQGDLPAYDMRYLREDYNIYLRIAFADVSMEKSMLHGMAAAYLQIGAVALTLLAAVSVALSHWATAPVEKAWRQQRQFLSDASHELKTPLTVILSNAELMESAALDERPARWADNIHSEAHRMKTLVEEMLTLARGDDMTHTAVPVEVNLSDAAVDCALAFEPVAFEGGKRLDYDVAEDIAVLGDRDKLKQVISILLDNAIKYGAAGAPVVLTLQKTERAIRLQVANDNGGSPIPPEQLQHLFERFYRADASRGEQSGFGLGLSIAAAIAAEHRGSLKAESDAESTRFILTLPIKRA